MKMGFIPKSGTFGADISGIIEAVGKDVSQFSVGDSVIVVYNTLVMVV